MPRAVLKGGVFHPIDPLPADWNEGREVLVEDADPGGADQIEAWYRDMEDITSGLRPEDDEQLMRAVAEVRCQAKEVARREAGLP